MASGFSHSTCLPAAIAAMAMGKCIALGVQTLHRLDRGIGQQCVVVGSDVLDSGILPELRGFGFVDGGGADDIDISQAANAFGVDLAHEAGPDYSRLYSAHNRSFSTGTPDGRIRLGCVEPLGGTPEKNPAARLSGKRGGRTLPVVRDAGRFRRSTVSQLLVKW